ncbi:MAG: hypothetical protein ACK46X_07655 [Candidatus Sericytochromatia bacterium]
MKRLTQTTMATLAAAVLLAGCGQGAISPAIPTAQTGAMQAEATKTLTKAFAHIHLAAFTKLDANSDKSIDEYEAGPSIDLKDFQKADKNRNGKLTKTEFMNYATGGSLFGFVRQDKNDFMKDTRDALAKAFGKLDSNRDRLLTKEEMTSKALKKLGIYLEIPGLHVKVTINEFDSELFAQNDRTGDKALSQAEFEDFCMDEFIYGINPNYSTEPAAPPAPPAEEPVAPPAEEV